MRVLFASSEAVPFAKTGGLGDVAGSLPRALKHAGAKAAVILPKYSTIPQEYQDRMKHVADFYVPLAWRNDYCGIEKLTLQGLDFYFVDNESYFKRDSLYGYFDDGERFAFFAKAVCEAIARVPELECDVLHCNDWQTALCPVFLREFYREVPACNNVKCVFTVHNVKFQGQYGDKMLQDVLGVDDIPAARDQLRCDADSINFMKGALCYSDWLTTVSPSYACELQMPFFGEGLDGIFRRRSNILSGILNGIDQGIWNPATDPMIPANFSPKDMSNKAECRRSWAWPRTPPARLWSPSGASPTRRAWAWCATPWTASWPAACRWPCWAPATPTRRRRSATSATSTATRCARASRLTTRFRTACTPAVTCCSCRPSSSRAASRR